MDAANSQSMSEKCVIDNCRHIQRALCKCCKQDLCYQHLWEHNDSIISQLNLLKNEIHHVNYRFKTLNIPEIIKAFQKQIKQWRINSYIIIDRLYDQKRQEFTEYIEENVGKQCEYMDQLQKQIDEFIEIEDGDQQEIKFIKSNINDINEKIDRIEKAICPITILPLAIDEHSIQINC
ncbi:unnamed protein product [Rotaria sordida]|uniref:Uncharacterized protein n=1 Tax=Rotaria sordida TaxID=392033 RepID=A0A819Z2X4_9BILA|nr:unnamed protein product [Rotaria sordida]CAF1287868.1 unnamed protein product [Rotaria sordida]CAF3752488.1 unnamed protein product [Rotaria sordida]CAF4163615.1 unnamed protein product [Rotaria sordida]